MEARRNIDLCTCGKPRVDAVHGMRVAYETNPNPNLHTFHPNPQPSAPPPTPEPFHRISAVRNVGWWVVDVYGTNKRGHGQAKNWLDAVNAAIEDLSEKKEKS